MSENIQEDVPQKAINLPPIKLAFIIDNEVVDVLHTDDRLAAIFLSNPLVLDVTEKIYNNPQSIIPGMLYNQETQEYYIKQEEEADV